MKKNSTIRSLEQKASAGNVKSAFQLYEYYMVGKYVDEDHALAKKYSDIVYEAVKCSALKISSITLKSFKGFSDLHIDFSSGTDTPNVIAFSGPNGVGKTTILNAISKSLSWISYRLASPKNTGEYIDFPDIYHSSSHATIIANVVLGDEIFQIDLSKSSVDSPAQKTGVLTEFSRLSDIYRHLNSIDEGFNLPLIAFYGVERAVEVSSRDERIDEIAGDSGQEKFDGYKKSLTGHADFKLFFKWFKYHQDAINADKSRIFEEINTISNEIQELISVVDKNESESPTAFSFLQRILSDKRQRLDWLNSRVEATKNDLSERLVHVVTNAISAFLPGFTNFRIQYKPVAGMIVDKNGVTLSVLQLSQGEKSLLALVGDIARRLVLLNPSLDDPRQGMGIVMIDEIDLHLHPAWQQNIIPKLSVVFPNLQFLITTHSPQVLSTIPRSCIRVLDVNDLGVGVAHIPNAFTYGEPSNDVMQSVMGVDPQPPVPEKVLLDELTSLVDQGKYESDSAKELLAELRLRLNDEHPQLQKIYRSIRRQEALKK